MTIFVVILKCFYGEKTIQKCSLKAGPGNCLFIETTIKIFSKGNQFQSTKPIKWNIANECLKFVKWIFNWKRAILYSGLKKFIFSYSVFCWNQHSDVLYWIPYCLFTLFCIAALDSWSKSLKTFFLEKINSVLLFSM